MEWAEAKAAALKDAYGDLAGRDLLQVMIGDEFPGRSALSSSFGAEAAVLDAARRRRGQGRGVQIVS